MDYMIEKLIGVLEKRGDSPVNGKKEKLDLVHDIIHDKLLKLMNRCSPLRKSNSMDSYIELTPQKNQTGFKLECCFDGATIYRLFVVIKEDRVFVDIKDDSSIEYKIYKNNHMLTIGEQDIGIDESHACVVRRTRKVVGDSIGRFLNVMLR